MTATGVSRRIEQCVARLHARDPEGALVNLFPAIDKTAKRRRPRAGVGARIKSFLHDEEVLITAVALKNVFRNCSFGGRRLHDALYEFGRCPIAHEGELDPRLTFNDDGGFSIGANNWNLPTSYIVGMALAVITAPENIGEATGDGIFAGVLGKQFLLNEIWGRPAAVRQHICDKFCNPNLFAPGP